MRNLLFLFILFVFFLSCEKENIDARIEGQPKCMLTDKETVLTSFSGEELESTIINYHWSGLTCSWDNRYVQFNENGDTLQYVTENSDKKYTYDSFNRLIETIETREWMLPDDIEFHTNTTTYNWDGLTANYVSVSDNNAYVGHGYKVFNENGDIIEWFNDTDYMEDGEIIESSIDFSTTKIYQYDSSNRLIKESFTASQDDMNFTVEYSWSGLVANFILTASTFEISGYKTYNEYGFLVESYKSYDYSSENIQDNALHTELHIYNYDCP